MERRHRRTLVEVLSTAVLILGCTPRGYDYRPDSLSAKNLTIHSARPADRVARRQARVIAARVAAGARHAEHEEEAQEVLHARSCARRISHHSGCEQTAPGTPQWGQDVESDVSSCAPAGEPAGAVPT